MKTRPKIHREISFSQSFQYHNQYEKSNFQSPAIAIEQKIHSTSRHKNLNENKSPLKDSYIKYLLKNQQADQFKNQQVDETQILRNRQQIFMKKQNFSQINKRIKRLLIDIQVQESRKTEFHQKVTTNISPNKIISPSDYGKIKNIKRSMPQNNNKFPSFINHQNKYFKRDVSKQKQNDFSTPSKQKCTINQTNFQDISTFKVENLQKSPLTEKKMNMNNHISKIEKHQSRNTLSPIKKSVYSNNAQKRSKNHGDSTQELIKAREIEEQMQLIDNKIQQLQRIKKQLQFQLPNKKSIGQNKIFESQLTKNSSLFTIKTKELHRDVQHQLFDSHLVQSQSKCSFKESNEQKMISQIKISNKQSGISVEDIKVPKIFKKIKDKKKGKMKEEISITNSNVLQSQRSNYEQNYQYFYEQQNRNTVINQKNNLLNELHYQIKLDDEFRKSKKWLQKLKINNNWALIMDQLQKNLYYISEQQIKNLFSLHQNQENPFYYPQEADFTIADCVKVFLAADRHWNYDIVHCFSQRSLLASNFNQQNIDINGKGHINIEDLTRYINSQLDTCYRNRDIYLIYNRFKTSEKLYYSKILNCLCNE